MEPERKDIWANGAAYESYVGRWSRLVAREFLAWLNVPPQSRWLDVGCGAGALSQAILDIASPLTTTGIDRSEGFVAYVREQIRDERASFEVGDAQALPAQSAYYDAVVSGLVLNFVPQPAKMVAEMRRVARPGGTVAAYVWDYAGQMQLMRYFWEAAVDFDPVARDLAENLSFPLCQPDKLTELFEEVGLETVEVRPVDIPTVFRDFDDYWSPFLGGQGPAPSYTMSLSEERRATLREKIRDSLPLSPDGTIHLIARAWAIRSRSQAGHFQG